MGKISDKKIAALYVDPKGVYSAIPDVELWGLPNRDAREYPGPWPVVAHPHCTRWCMLSGLVEARHGWKQGDDGGCFLAALKAVRRWGGVIEHPAFSKAWAAYDLNAHPTGGGWIRADWHTGNNGWTCYVEQHKYGHKAKKATWLYVCGVELLSLRWGCTLSKDVKFLVSDCHKDMDSRPRLRRKDASATPRNFADVLVEIAFSKYSL